MKKLLTTLILGITLFNSELLGVMIEITPSNQQVLVGSSFEVELFISDLGDFVAPSVGTYDLDIDFDPTVVSFDSVVFGDPVLGNQLDLFGFGSIQDENSGGGVINVFELSLDLPIDLDLLQAESFALATLTFNAVSAGTSQLSLTTNAVGDALGNPLVTTVGSASVQAVVPEPSTVILLGMGVIAVVARHRRKKL